MIALGERLRDAGRDPEARRALESLRGLPHGESFLAVEQPEELADVDESGWSRIRLTLARSPRDYEGLLRRISFRREKPLPEPLRRSIARFLAAAYVHCSDLRFLNEYLWFETSEDAAWSGAVLARFGELATDVFHPFPLASAAEAGRAIAARSPAPANAAGGPHRVALLGNPLRFGRLHDLLRSEGMEAVPVFFPWHRRPWLEALLRRPAVSLAVLRARGNRLPVRVVSFRRTDPGVTSWLRALGCAAAVHRLGFIIRRNVIDAFPRGILNDHLAVLPHVRGRATVEYSVLYGFPVCSTLHIVDEGVDTGPIVGIFPIPVPRDWSGTSLQLKDRVAMRDKDMRFAAGLRLLLSPGFRPGENPREGGLQHYTLHPALRRHLDTEVLPEYVRRFGV